MKTRLLKNANLNVSEVGMGCMGFSHGYGAVPEEEYSIDAIHRAYEEGGCTFFDTAEVYGDVVYYPGHNEQLVGKALEPFRKDIVLATKFKIGLGDLADGTSVADAVRKHLAQSMKNLRTDYIDLYYLHRIDENVSFEEIAEVMGGLIQLSVAGVCRRWMLTCWRRHMPLRLSQQCRISILWWSVIVRRRFSHSVWSMVSRLSLSLL